MKVIKRDGTIVPFDIEKIIVAINKAFVEVDGALYEEDTANDIAYEIGCKVANMKELPYVENKPSLEKTKKESNSKELATNKVIYKVKQGDTLEAIAKKYKVSVKKLKIDNKKNSSKLKIGENIEIIK